MLERTGDRRLTVAVWVVTAIVLCLSYYFLLRGTLRVWDSRIQDFCFQLRGPVSPGDDIVIVGLDDRSARALGRKAGGWQRADFARLVEALSAAGADLVAIDYLFLQPGLQGPEQDEQLRAALQNSANVILSTKAQDEDVSTPLNIFREQEVGEGFINLFPDSDGIVRRMAFARARAGAAQNEMLFDFPFSLTVALARLYPDGNYKMDLKGDRVSVIGSLRIPKSGNSATDGFYINFAGPSFTFPVIPMHDALAGKFDPGQVRGKIVLVGNMNQAEHDYFTVPFRSSGDRGSGGQISGFASHQMQSMFGIEIHANAIHTLLTGRFLSPLPTPAASVLLAILAAAIMALLYRQRVPVIAGVVLSILCIALFSFGCYRAFLRGILVPASPIYFVSIGLIITGVAFRELQEAAERGRVTSLFGRYVAPNVVQQLITNRDLMKFGGRKERLTVFFSDVRGFTTMSEKLPPEEVSSLLNEYFSRMTRIVFKHQGTLDKFIGDALMAFFGNPVPLEDHARRAVQMALDMRTEMQELKAMWARQGKENSFDIGMGINTGEMVVGNLGSTDFFDYTVIGDEVNLACRLESVAARGQILISENTYQEVKDFFDVRKLEPVKVKGKSQPVQVYEVLSAR